MKVADIIRSLDDEEALEAHHIDHTGFGYDPGDHCELCREQEAFIELVAEGPEHFELVDEIELGFLPDPVVRRPWDYNPWNIGQLPPGEVMR